MRVIITGATGFIGKRLSELLVESGYEVVGLTRNVNKGKQVLGEKAIVVGWDGRTASGWGEYADGAKAIVNLAGENVGSGLWTEKKKEKILKSRLDAGRAAVEAVESAVKKPESLIQASAIGYYGSVCQERVDESCELGRGFLAEVVGRWEPSTEPVEDMGVRRALIRTGLVIGKGGGALTPMLLQFKLFAGGYIGSGENWVSWIHLDDEALAIKFLIENDSASGIYNFTAPNPVRMKELAAGLGKAMGRPSWLKVPGLPVKALLGDMAEETLLSSQEVHPDRLLEDGYKFKYPDLDSALKEIVE